MSFLLAVVALVLAVVALTRTKALASLQQRVSELENDQTDLRRRFNTLRREAAPQEVPAPSPASAPVPAAIERPAPPPPPPPPLAPPTPPRVATPTPPAELPPPEPPKPPFDWERWIGIRGAAVLGGIALALAGLLFFQYSIQHGLISKTMRVTLGFITGVLCLTGSEWVRRRGYRPASEGLAGAGVVVLYAAVWAGYARYQLLPLWVAFLLMALVTAACGLLAVRRAAPFVAILGTVGGFATPLLLSIQRERPLGLFGYVLLLDIGLLAVGKRQRWPWIGLIGLGGTVLLQALWLGTRTGPGGLLLSLAILAVFAAVFTIGGFARGTEGESPWRGMQAGGLLLPFVFAVYFASRADLGRHLWGIAAFAALLGIGASWSGKKAGLPALGSAAATGSLATLAVWLLRTPATPGIAWEAVAIASGFAAIYHVALEWNGEVDGMFGPSPAAVVTSVGGAVLLLVASMMTPLVPPWPWLAGWLVLGALLVRQADLTRLPALQVIASGGVAAMFGLQHVAHAKAEAFPPPGTYAGAALGVAVLAQVVPFLRRDHDMRRSAEHGAAVAAVALSVTLLMSPLLVSLPTVVALGLPVAFGLLILLAATRLGEGEWGLGAVLVTALVHASWTFVRPHGAPDPPSVPTAMLLMFAAVVLFVAWPFLARGRIASTRWIWWAAAAAGPLWFFPLRKLGMVWPGPATIGLVPVALGALALAAVFGVRAARGVAEEARRSAIVGLSAVAISFASVAIPLQLDKSWITIGWALEGLGLVLLWRRLDHPGLKWFGLAHLIAAAVRLVPTAVLLDSYPRSGTPIVNWLLYTYLVPAAAMFAAAWLLGPDEAARARPFEKELYAKGRPFGAILASLGGIFTVFVWINLAIADWFADGPRLTLQFGRAPARDLTVSIAWAVYALILLGFGMARGRTGLRWLSLGFLLVTIGKVFLYDLGELRDLYRVLSLVGLALSLLLVSVLYQRFVFRRPVEKTG